MTIKGQRAWIRDDEELQICRYTLEFRHMQRTELAGKIQAEVHWPGKPPEIEVLERKISKYRKHAVDHPEDRPWSMATLDKYPIPPQAIPAVLACWKQRVESSGTLTIREAKWVSKLYALMADEVRQSFVWRHGVKWLESEPSCNNEVGIRSYPDQSSQRNTKTGREFLLRLEEADCGVIECPKCQTPIGIGPTSQKAICVGCEGQFDIVRIPVRSEQSDAVCRETSVTKNISPIIKDVKELYHYAAGYAHLELIYDLIGQPFDSTYMDMLVMRLGEVIPDPDEEASLLPYLALAIEDFKQFKDKIREASQ
ncbi:MAG: hypothetical protein ACLFVA_06495 [Dehalococcoidia bacterium]